MALEQCAGAPHLSRHDDCLVKVARLLAIVGDWQRLLNSALPEEESRELRGHGRTGRPLGDEAFLERLEALVGRILKPQKGGRPVVQRSCETSNVSTPRWWKSTRPLRGATHVAAHSAPQLAARCCSADPLAILTHLHTPCRVARRGRLRGPQKRLSKLCVRPPQVIGIGRLTGSIPPGRSLFPHARAELSAPVRFNRCGRPQAVWLGVCATAL